LVDYKTTICGALANLRKPFNFIDDSNEKIDAILSNEEIKWYPTYLVECENQLFMFMPFCYEHFIDDSEVKEECKNAQHLIDCLKNKETSSKVFFITNVNEDVKALELQDLSNDFGILHNEWTKPLLDYSIRDIFNVKCKLIPKILKYLSNCKNLKGEIGNLIRNFSKRYLKEKPEDDRENEMIKEFMEQILTCDDRFKLDIDSINFMAEIERIVTRLEGKTREHYFHTCNTMMLGFMIIDKLYNIFATLLKKYGDDIVLEFVWILTSLYHDIGYPILLQEPFICQSYGLERESDLALIHDSIKQQRQNIWDSPEYIFVVEVLNNLFNHIYHNKKGKWVFNGFQRPSPSSTKFKNSVKISFIEKEAHGAAGTLKLALLTNTRLRDVEKYKVREFLYRHAMLASISILFHDSKVRYCFRENSIKRIKAKNFLFSVLLTYVDILQDDRRDSTGSSSNPDIFKDISIPNGKTIVAKLEESILTEGIKNKLFEELKEALAFFIMNGLTFDIPEELLIIKS